MGNCIVEALSSNTKIKANLDKESGEFDKSVWMEVATLLNVSIIVFKGEKNGKIFNVPNPIFEEPLAIILDKEYSGILYTANQVATLAESNYLIQI